MGIFATIREKIFGKAKPAQPTSQASAQAMPQMGQAQPTPQPQPQPQPVAQQPVDVEAVLNGIMAEKGQPDLNWRTSIVDLMKLLDMDSSLDNRKELATELGYTGAKDGSAEMNIWLHKAVMKELERNGGNIPADLRD